MTKRKASVALDSANDSTANSLKTISSNNNGNTNSNINNSLTLGNACTDNNGNNTINRDNVASQDGRTLHPSSMSNTGECQQQETSNNQNDNSVDSNGTNNAGNGRHRNKKERADNWSSAEIQILHKGIESRRDVFYGPPNQVTKKNRESAWEAITREVNAVSTTPRSLGQVMKKFKNEKCRAKSKFANIDKEGHSSNDNSVSNNNLMCNNNTDQTNNNQQAANNRTTANDATATINLSAQNQNPGNQQQQQQQMAPSQHHMTNPDTMSAPQSSINVVKLAPQNVAKTMIDLPGHVQHIQMPNDDMVLIVPPDMDSLLSGVNIVSDVNGHHHFQKCSGNGNLSNHPHSQHSQHSLQTLNTGQALVNGTVSNGTMMTRTPFCILNQVECATGNETGGPDHHVAQNVVNQSAFTTNHIGIGTQNSTHHRGTMIDQSQGQQQHHHQLHHHPQQQHQLQPSQHQPHPSHLSNSHNQHHLPQNHLTTTAAVTSNGGIAIESQLKNLLFNLLLKDGQQSSTVQPLLQSSTQESKHRSDMLAVIASSLTKIESHLSKISKVASTLLTHNLNLGEINERTSSNQVHNSSSAININSDGNNNNVDISSRSGNRRDD